MHLCIGGGLLIPAFLIELTEIDTGGSGGRSAPGLYESGAEIEGRKVPPSI